MADPIQMVRSRAHLKRVRGGRDGLYPFLEHNTWDMVHYFDDFLGDEIRGSGGTPGVYELNTGDDGVLSILADQTNGVAELSASTGAGGDDEYAFIALPELNWTAQQNAVMAVRLNIDAITTVKIADDAVTTAKIPDDAVTAAKIHDAVELGGPSLGTSSVIRTNANTISENITFASNTNGISAGPISIASGNFVAVSSGTTWSII